MPIIEINVILAKFGFATGKAEPLLQAGTQK